jgi:hypothetical protein
MPFGLKPHQSVGELVEAPGAGEASHLGPSGLRDARDGNGAFRFIVAIDRDRRRPSAWVGKRPAAKTPSKVPDRFKRSAAPLDPTPRAPGSLSEGSPRRAMKSGTWSGSTPCHRNCRAKRLGRATLVETR